MLKIIILATFALLVGLGGGSAFSVMQAKQAFASQGALHAKAVSDSLAKSAADESQHAAATVDSSGRTVDSTQAEPVHATSGGEAPGAPADSSAASPATKGPQTPLAAPAKGTAAAATPAATPAAGATWNRAVATVNAGATTKPSIGLPATRGPSVSSTGSAPTLAPERLSKIFAAMPAKEAAKVLVQLDDIEVQMILGSLNAKQAAAVLQNFPPDRAAAISKAALRGGATKP